MRKKQWPFSPGERLLLSLLPKDGRRVSSLELIDQIYSGRERPHNARVAVGDLIRRTRHKMEIHGGDHRLGRSLRRGPRPITVWLKMASRGQEYRPPEFEWEKREALITYNHDNTKVPCGICGQSIPHIHEDVPFKS